MPESKETKLTYPIVTSNILLPMELDTAMSPKPFLATKTLVIRSGMLVPAARNVSPITCETKDTRDFSFAGLYGTGNRFLINNFQNVKLDLFKIPKHKNAFYKARVKFSEGLWTLLAI